MSRRRVWGDDSTVRLGLSGGATVTLSFKGNLFDLAPAERRLISDLTATIQIYKDAGTALAEARQNETRTHEPALAEHRQSSNNK
jgi:hypothetical protein